MDILRVAIVGCGRISDLHVLGYHDRKDAKIVALCDNNYSRLMRKANAWGIDKVYKDYKKLLEDDEVDLIELLVPHHLHAEMTIAAATYGKHISVQKPMAISVNEANQMIAAAENARGKARIYENFIFYPPIVQAKKMVDFWRDWRTANASTACYIYYKRKSLEYSYWCIIVANKLKTMWWRANDF